MVGVIKQFIDERLSQVGSLSFVSEAFLFRALINKEGKLVFIAFGHYQRNDDKLPNIYIEAFLDKVAQSPTFIKKEENGHPTIVGCPVIFKGLLQGIFVVSSETCNEHLLQSWNKAAAEFGLLFDLYNRLGKWEAIQTHYLSTGSDALLALPQVLASTEMFFCLHNDKGEIVDINQFGSNLMGFTEGELVNKSLYNYILPTPEAENMGLSGHSFQGTTVNLKRKNTQIIKMFYKKKQLDKSLFLSYAIPLDFESKKEDEVLIKASEIAELGGWVFDPVTMDVYWSNAVREIFNVNDHFKPKLSSIERFILPKYLSEWSTSLNDALQKGKNYDLEMEIRTEKGRVLWVRAIGHPVMTGNQCVKLYGVYQDINLRKIVQDGLEFERSRINAFIKHTPAPISMLDTNFDYLAVSDAWYDFHKIATEKVVGRYVKDVFPEIPDNFIQAFQEALKGETVKIDHFELVDTERVVNLEIKPWFGHDGSISGLMVHTEDITNWHKHRTELAAAKLKAERANVAKSEFLANMSHEIRTPLNSVIGFSDLLLAAERHPDKKRHLAVLNQSAHSLLHIIDDILDFSKIEAGKLELNLEKVNLRKLLEEVADIAAFSVHKKKIELLLDVPTAIPMFVMVDGLRLKQVLINLLGNAVKFTDRGEILLKVELLNGNVTYRFSVSDSGIGISSDKQQAIFDAFTQGESTTTKIYGGTGLGLTISNNLLKLMHSFIQLESEVNMGAVFYFDIELQTLEETATEEYVNLSLVKNILVIDDNIKNRLIISDLLVNKGVKIDAAASVKEGLEKLSNAKQYDVILIDYHMPEITDMEIIMALKNQNSWGETSRDTPIVLMLNYAGKEELTQFETTLSTSEFLAKPIKRDELYTVLAKVSSSDYKLNSVVDVPMQPPAFTKRKYRILIAEDNEANMMLAKTLVKQQLPLAEIIGVTNGIDVIQNCEFIVPDLILMDLYMPLMDGFETTAYLRKVHARHFPIIAFTASAISGVREKCVAAGMDDFLSKPILENKLRDKLYRWLPDTSNQPENVLKHFDSEQVYGYFQGNSKNILSFWVLLVKEFEGMQQKLKDLTENFDAEAITALAHKLSGMSANAGLGILSQKAGSLEHLEPKSEEEVMVFIYEILEEIDFLYQLIDDYIAEL